MKSKNYKHWISEDDLKRCKDCKNLQGKIYGITEVPNPKPPLHPFCRCIIKIMEAFKAGTATDNKLDGADFWLKYLGSLPKYYINSQTAFSQGWEPNEGNLSEVCPGKMIYGGVFENRKGQLPMSPNRIWYEADINYKSGYRNSQRILWSNDGLIFMTYDHYRTYCEII